MSSYTIRNLKELEDSAVAFGLSPTLEARFGRAELDCEQVGISYQRIAPEARHPLAHRHGKDEEIYVVVGGSGRVKLGEDVRVIQPWDAIRVAPDTVRAFAAGPDGLELIAFGTHAENDAELTEVDWPD